MIANLKMRGTPHSSCAKTGGASGSNQYSSWTGILSLVIRGAQETASRAGSLLCLPQVKEQTDNPSWMHLASGPEEPMQRFGIGPLYVLVFGRMEVN